MGNRGVRTQHCTHRSPCSTLIAAADTKTPVPHPRGADIVNLLLQNEARPDAADYSAGATALMLAARNGSLAAAEALVTAGANVNAATQSGTSVLMHAVANGSVPLVSMLLEVSGAHSAGWGDVETATRGAAAQCQLDKSHLLAHQS